MDHHLLDQVMGKGPGPRSFMRGALLCGLLITGCIMNGPDVMSGKSAEKRLSRACAAKVLLEFFGQSDSLGYAFTSPPALCATSGIAQYRHREMYLTGAVDYCEKAIMNIQAKNYQDFTVLYILTINSICDLKPVRPFDFKKPFQWGL